MKERSLSGQDWLCLSLFSLSIYFLMHSSNSPGVPPLPIILKSREPPDVNSRPNFLAGRPRATSVSPPETGLHPLGQLSLCPRSSPQHTIVEPQNLKSNEEGGSCYQSFCKGRRRKTVLSTGRPWGLCHQQSLLAFPLSPPNAGSFRPPRRSPAPTPVPKNIVSCAEPQAVQLCPPACGPLSHTRAHQLALSHSLALLACTSGGLLGDLWGTSGPPTTQKFQTLDPIQNLMKPNCPPVTDLLPVLVCPQGKWNGYLSKLAKHIPIHSVLSSLGTPWEGRGEFIFFTHEEAKAQRG